MEPRPWRPYMKQEEEEGVSSCGGIPWGGSAIPPSACPPQGSDGAPKPQRACLRVPFGFQWSHLACGDSIQIADAQDPVGHLCPSQETSDPNASSSSSDITNFHCSSRGPRALSLRPRLETDDGRNLELFQFYGSKELGSRGKSRDFPENTVAEVSFSEVQLILQRGVKGER